MNIQLTLMKAVIIVFSCAFIWFSGYNGGGDRGYAELSSTGNSLNNDSTSNVNVGTGHHTAVLSPVDVNKNATRVATIHTPGEKFIFSADRR